ncbi:MAG: 2-hydroxyglutaryl-CoA dehydratase [Clostridiales bacterium]|nr:2-hydroxyglutaryl-CoA dehydratase [Clostridiales bacterium]
MAQDYIRFTKEMKRDYTILIPNMLPVHFRLISRVFQNYGYKTELLETEGPQIGETGLKYVHNDTCYPAILVIGQFIDAIKSGRYDPHKVALVLFQTGGGCRASNYISLLRKALERAGYEYVPVISFSLAGIEKHPGWKLTPAILHRLLYAVMYGDLMMTLENQTKPYELNHGDAAAKSEYWCARLTDEMAHNRISYGKVLKNYRDMIFDFASIPMNRTEKVKVGIVGEIFVKFSPLGNNNLADFLNSEGAEVVIPGLLDFCMYCVYNGLVDKNLYGRGRFTAPVQKLAYKFLLKKQYDMINIMKENGMFRPSTPFDHTVSLADGYISHGVKMGEGWLLTAEMLELADEGVNNIVCTQPFGCLPNHICGKGMMKPLKAKNPDLNIIAIDYDTGASVVNQQNRIKLMLAGAARMKNKKSPTVNDNERTDSALLNNTPQGLHV